MSEVNKLLQKVVENAFLELHTAMLCKVESFDETAGAANIIPCYKVKFAGKEAEDRPLLIDVPVLKQKYKQGATVVEQSLYLEKGDIVLVVFTERANDVILDTRDTADPVYNRRHALDDGIIIGVV